MTSGVLGLYPSYATKPNKPGMTMFSWRIIATYLYLFNNAVRDYFIKLLKLFGSGSLSEDIQQGAASVFAGLVHTGWSAKRSDNISASSVTFSISKLIINVSATAPTRRTPGLMALFLLTPFTT